MTAPDRPGGLAEVLDDHLAAEFAMQRVPRGIPANALLGPGWSRPR